MRLLFCKEHWELVFAHVHLPRLFQYGHNGNAHEEALLCPPAGGALQPQLLHPHSEELKEGEISTLWKVSSDAGFCKQVPAYPELM